MIKIEGIFKVCFREQYAFISNLRFSNNQIARCFFADYDKKRKEWNISWTTSNLNQLMLGIQNKASKKIERKEVSSELLELIQQQVNEMNKLIIEDKK